jgi:hypothetical protein
VLRLNEHPQGNGCAFADLESVIIWRSGDDSGGGYFSFA